MDGVHDVVQALVHFLGAPADVHSILAHLEAAGGHTAGVDSLAWSKDHLGLDEGVDGFGGAAHI